MSRLAASRALCRDAAKAVALYRRNPAAAIRGINTWAAANSISAEQVSTLLQALQAASTAEIQHPTPPDR